MRTSIIHTRITNDKIHIKYKNKVSRDKIKKEKIKEELQFNR